MDDTSTTAVDTTDTVLEIPRKMESDTSNTTTSLETTASHEEEEEEEPEAEPEPQEEEEEPVIDDDGSSQGSLDEDEFNPYVFIKSLPAYDLVAPLRPPIALPPKRKDAPLISLVLDLDETLVHCTVEPVDDADLVFPVVFHGMTYQVHVRLRPHLFQFLEKIHGQYEVTVFTASQKVYANELLDLIDPGT
jgi:CTD small phosphatase-like protein 2